MYYRDFNEHKKSDKTKWIISFALIFLLICAVFVLLVSVKPFCMFGHEFESGVCFTCGEICSHEKVGEDNTCKKCGEVVESSTESTDEINTTPDVVNANGDALVSNTAYSLADFAFVRTTAMSTTAYEGITLTAKIEPSYATNQKVDWLVSWSNPNSEWATGKTVTDYVTITPNGDGALTVVVTCLAPFGEQIKIEVVSRDNVDIKASANVDYLQTVTDIQLKIGDIVLNPGDNYIEDFVLTSGKVGPGGEVSVEYISGDVYTIGLEDPSYGVFFLDYDLEGSGKQEDFAYEYEAYDSSTKQYNTVSSSWAMNESVAENAGDYSVITFDIDWFVSRFYPYCTVPVLGADNGWDENSELYDKTISATRDLKDVPTDVLVKMFESAIENGTDVLLQINVPVAHIGGFPESVYFTIKVGSILDDFPVESVSIVEGDITFNNNEE